MSIVLQYENTTIQSGDINGNIAHQGVLASNITGSEVLSYTFPTTNTGTSLGHYHYTETSSNALQFLNSSGSGIGGHQLWSSNDAHAPIKIFDVNTDRAIIDTSLRNTTNKTILDTTNNTLTLYDALGTTNSVMASGYFNIINQPESTNVGIANNRLFVSQTVSDITTNIYAGQVQQTDIPNLNQSVLTTTSLDINKVNTIQKSVLTSEELTITDLSSNVSVLSPTDLTFNGNSIFDEFEELRIKSVVSSLQFPSSAITADGRPPIAPTNTIINTYAFSPSWYFKNTFNSGVNKINWYIGPNIGMTVADVLGLYLNIFNPSMTSNDSCPFITVYTANDAVPPVNWYKSRRTYIFDQSVTPVINTRYFMFANVSTTCPTPFTYGSVLNNLEITSEVGAFAPTEVILAFSIGTNSAAPINTVEFATNKFGIMTPNGTQEVLFIPST